MNSRKFLFAALLSAMFSKAATAADIHTTRTYYDIGGATIQEIEQQLERRGPRLGGHKGHPAATRMEFKTRVEYLEKTKLCRVSAVQVRLIATMTLPRWKRPRNASREIARFWQALDQDILRHEKHHVAISTDHARELEHALANLSSRKGCAALEREVDRITGRIMKQNDEAHAAFDRKEGNEFAERLGKLLRQRGSSVN